MSRECRFAGLVIAGLAFVSTAPALAAVETGVPWNKFIWDSPAHVDIPQYSAIAFSFPGQPQSLTVQGIRVYHLWPKDRQPQTAVADVQFWWRNGTSPWMKYGLPQRAQSEIRYDARIPQSAYSVVLPPVTVPVPPGGYNYTVTVTISWWSYGNNYGQRTYWFNSAPDYFPIGDADIGAGWILIR